jgi:hypothetical protein
MDNRGQFTFYRSFWEAVQSLPKKDKLPVLEAIISYALDGVVPTGLTQSQSAFFLLVKPNLDASRKKAANGKQGGSKPKANASKEQTKKEREKEKEKENEIEIEGEKEKEQRESKAAGSFASFWAAYPKRIAEEDAAEAWAQVARDGDTVMRIMAGLENWKKADQWREDGGRFVPKAAKFLLDGYWKAAPAAVTEGRVLDDDEQAAILRILQMGGDEDA